MSFCKVCHSLTKGGICGFCAQNPAKPVMCSVHDIECVQCGSVWVCPKCETGKKETKKKGPK